MARRRKSDGGAIPDNLDPLVDTLSNVVGILIVVIALTQIELGDALARVVELDEAAQEEALVDEANETETGEVVATRDFSSAARAAGGATQSTERAERVLAALQTLPREQPASESQLEDAALRVERARGKLREARAAAAQRGDYVAALRSVPAERVARIPNPQEFVGRESWILIRYGRVFLVDRERLYDEALHAFDRLLPDIGRRPIRPDEFESVARYLRKRDIGFGSFRWQLQTDPEVRVELTWRSPDAGIERTRLDEDPALATWLRLRNPQDDAIRFWVWADSFETYLDVRQRVETAGFRAGWSGIEVDDELDLGITIGPRNPDRRAVPID
ncbi:MAG: hypothetical protein AB8G23_16395 [Myxococcota bacterium]